MLRELALPEGAFASSQDAEHRRRRGAHPHVDGGRRRGPMWRPLLASRSSTPFDRPRRSPAETRSRLLAVRPSAPQPGRDDKAIASWNGLALAALAEAGRRLERDDWLERPGGSPTSCSGRSRPTAACTAASGPGRRRHRLPRRLRQRARTASTSCTWRRVSCVPRGVRAAWPCWPSSCSPTRSARLLHDAGRRRAAGGATKDLDNTDAVRELDARLVLLRLARIYATTSSSGAPCPLLRLLRRRSPQPVLLRLALVRARSPLLPPRELAIVGRP